MFEYRRVLFFFYLLVMVYLLLPIGRKSLGVVSVVDVDDCNIMTLTRVSLVPSALL